MLLIGLFPIGKFIRYFSDLISFVGLIPPKRSSKVDLSVFNSIQLSLESLWYIPSIICPLIPNFSNCIDYYELPFKYADGDFPSTFLKAL